MSRSTLGKYLWFLFGERLLVTCVIASIAPGAYAIWLIRESNYRVGLFIVVAWLPLYLLVATTLHRQGILRLWLSLSAAVVLLLAWTVVIIGIG